MTPGPLQDADPSVLVPGRSYGCFLNPPQPDATVAPRLPWSGLQDPAGAGGGEDKF